MEHAGTAVAAAARALLVHNAREGRPVLILAGPGNNGGDGFVAARRLAGWGTPVIAVLVATEEKPGTPDAARNWKRLDGLDDVTKIHAPVARDVAILGQGIEKAGIVVDALLGTGVRGRLREPVRDGGRGHPPGPRGRDPRPCRGHADRRGPHLGRSVGPGRARGPDRDLPPPEDRAALEDRAGARRADPRRPDRHPARRRTVADAPAGRPRGAAASPPRSCSSCSLPPTATALLPREGQAVVFHTPLLIVVLVVGTALVLWRILRSSGTLRPTVTDQPASARPARAARPPGRRPRAAGQRALGPADRRRRDRRGGGAARRRRAAACGSRWWSRTTSPWARPRAPAA